MTTLPHTIVLASAGTGKTFRLANRYIALLAAGAEPSSILATTFTRKAAGEILSRILSRLAGAAGDPGALAELRRHTGADLSARRCLELIGALARGLHRVRVFTIDAFFARLVSAFGAELGVGPGWKILEEHEDTRLRSRAVEEALSTGDQAQLLEWLTGLSGGPGREVHSAILREVSRAYRAYLDAGRRDHWAFFGPDGEPMEPHAIAEACRALRALPLPLTAAGVPHKAWQSAIQQACEAAEAGDWDDIVSRGLGAKIAAHEDAFNRCPISDGARAVFGPLIRQAAHTAMAAFRARNLACAALLERFDAAYTRLKAGAGRFTFDDVPRRLAEAGLDGRLAEVYYRLDGAIGHLLLDEFQDTSLQQFRLLEPIIDELASRDDRSVFCVGDAKQSLYTWRGAEPDLLPTLPQRWPQLCTEGLSQNFRSSPAILDAVNTVFGSLVSNPAAADQPAASTWAAAFLPHTAHHASRPGQVRLVVCPDAGEGAKRDEIARATLRAAAARAAEVLADQPGARIGILFRRNKPIPRMVHELARLGLDGAGEGGNPLADAPPVAAVASLFQLADHPGDTAALFHLATSPLGAAAGLADPFDIPAARRVSSALRARLARDGAAVLLTDLLARCEDSMDQRGAGRFNQAIELADEFDRSGGGPADFARLLWSRPVEEPGRRHISVLTVHRAKGLEFDAVILPELDTRWAIDHRSILIGRRDAEGRSGPLAPVYAVTGCPSERLRRLHPGLHDLYQRCHDRLVGEELCALYVAMTRAIHSLDMIVPYGSMPGLCGGAILCSALAPGAERAPGATLFSAATGEQGPWAGSGKAVAPAAAPAPLKITLRAPPSTQPPPCSPESVDLGALWGSTADSTAAL